MCFILWSVIACAEEAPPAKELTHDKTFKNPDFSDEEPTIRIKDITQIQNVRDNHLVGYGLVVGLNGSGDTLASSPQTQESLVSMLERLGVNVRDGTMSGKNVAAVMVTATLPAFSRSGSRIDVNVSAIGDAKDLRGGTLLVTPLLGADSNVYSVAQGNISVSGITGQGNNASQTKGVPTAGKISNGGLIEKEIGYELADLKEIKITLNTPDFTTAKRIANAINEYAKTKQWGAEIAKPLDLGTIQMSLPKTIKPFDFFHEIGHLEIQPDQKAKVLIDTQKDIIVVTNGVKMSPCAVASGSTIVKIIEIPEVYMPNLPNGGILPTINTVAGVNTNQLADLSKKIKGIEDSQSSQFRILLEQQQKQIMEIENNRELDDTAKKNQITPLKAQQESQIAQLKQFFAQQMLLAKEEQISTNATSQNIQQIKATSAEKVEQIKANATQPVVTSQTKVNIREEKGKFNLLSSGASLDKFVNALNQLGVPVKDVGSILMTIKNAGALHAEIIMS